jgi:hypothetical protein
MSKVRPSESGEHASAVEARGAVERPAREQKRSYLRAVYPLNPGIPHYLDFPRGRD